MINILKRLVVARKAAGKTQHQAGALIGLATSSYSDMERGATVLTVERLMILCLGFNVSPVWVLTGIQPTFPAESVLEHIREAKDCLADAIHYMEESA